MQSKPLLSASMEVVSEPEKYPKIHPRIWLVDAAERKLSEFVLELEKTEKLTIAEVVKILTLEAATWAKYQIQAERHPDDSSKSGDEA